MERNVIYATILSVIIMIAWGSFVNKNVPKNTGETKKTKVLHPKTPKHNTQRITETKSVPVSSNLNLELEKFGTVSLENKIMKLTFNLLGARLVQVYFKRYDTKFFTDKLDIDAPYFLFKPFDKTLFSLAKQEPKELVFVSEAGDKIKYTISNDRVLNIHIQTQKDLVQADFVYRRGKKSSRFGLDKDPLKRDRAFMYYNNGSFELVDDSDMEDNPNYTISPLWIALADRYFTIALMPEANTKFTALSFRHYNDKNEMLASIEPLTDLEYKMYIGEKDVDYLRKVDKTLDSVIDYGIYTVLAVPMLEFMKYIHKYIPNYGWAIVILTLIIRLLLFPLQHKSMKSMQRMQVLQPQMAKLKEKYKDDKETLNKEMMRLMSTHKVNPASGCLPMLLQMPIIFALYRVLGQAVELYREPWILWIHDLSVKDPYYILPVLMGLAMYIQQRLSPAKLDPMQAKMMIFMPVFMAVIMATLPSGLTLYILATTLFGLAQQLLINKQTS